MRSLTHTSAKEPYVSAKESFISAKEPYISANESYSSAEKCYSRAKEPFFLCIFFGEFWRTHQISFSKSHISPQNIPISNLGLSKKWIYTYTHIHIYTHIHLHTRFCPKFWAKLDIGIFWGDIWQNPYTQFCPKFEKSPVDTPTSGEMKKLGLFWWRIGLFAKKFKKFNVYTQKRFTSSAYRREVGGWGRDPKKMYGERLGDGVEVPCMHLLECPRGSFQILMEIFWKEPRGNLKRAPWTLQQKCGNMPMM